MIAIVAAIAASVALGLWLQRRFGERAQAGAAKLIDVLLWVVLPPTTFLVVARLELDDGVGAGLLIAYVVLATVGTLAFLICDRLLGLPRPATGALVVATILANTGYLGIPLCAALLGEDAFGEAVAFDVLVSGVVLYTAGFGVGAAFGTRAGEGARERAKAFFLRNPVLPAVAAGLLVPDALAPAAAVDVAEVALFALLPVGFVILGIHLMHEQEDGVMTFPPPLSAGVGTVLGLRLAVAPLLFAAIAAVTVDVPDAYLVQAAMPSGINTLIVSHVYGLDLRLAASAVAWSTAAVVAAATVVAAF